MKAINQTRKYAKRTFKVIVKIPDENSDSEAKWIMEGVVNDMIASANAGKRLVMILPQSEIKIETYTDK